MSDNKDRFNGTEAENDAYVGRDGEITWDRDNEAMRFHNGRTQGGVGFTQVVRTSEVTEVAVTIARSFVGANSNVLAKALSDTATTIIVYKNNLTSGNRIVLERGGSVEWLAVTSGATATGDFFSYTVTRDLASSGALSFAAGTQIANTGQTGSIFIDLHGGDGIGGESGPSFTVYRRNSATYNDITPIYRLGELDGSFGYSASTFGLGLGENGTNIWVTWDETNGLQFHSTAGVIAKVHMDGNIQIGEQSASKISIWRTGAGKVEIRNNTGVVAEVDTSGVVTITNATNTVFSADPASNTLALFGVTKIVQPAHADQAALPAQNHAEITDNSGGTSGVATIAAISDPADTPVSADALRDDLVANTLPEIRNAIATLAGQLNSAYTDRVNERKLETAIRTALVNLGVIKGSA